MAFRQPTHAPPQRQVPAPERPEPLRTTSYQSSAAALRKLEDSQEWVLFSPSQAASTSHTHTTSTSRTPRTAGLSRLSDLGSLETAARSYDRDDEDDRGEYMRAGGDADEDDEAEELDSLDSHLHAFREPSVYHTSSKRRLDESGGTVLPTHDGLGTFPASSSGVQEQLWAFEQFNPRRRSSRRRRSSAKPVDPLEQGEAEENSAQAERMRRIEKWRMEQSRVLLDEIEKETRRRRMTRESDRLSRTLSMAQDEMITLGSTDKKRGATEETPSAGQTGELNDNGENESFWTRITRRVIRDLMGIDDTILSVILGESLPEDATSAPVAPLDLETAMRDEGQEAFPQSSGWEDRLLHRIARELGVFIHQFSEHPGAFSSYLRTIQEVPEYAGLPNSNGSIPPPTTAQQSHVTPNTPYEAQASTDSPFFNPTIPLGQQEASPTHHAALWGLEEESPIPTTSSIEADRLAREREYWERELDVKMVFSFLRNRFTSRFVPPTNNNSFSQPAPLSTSPEDTARRVARVQQHHPLVSQQRAQQQRRRAMHHSQSQHILAPSSNSVSIQRWRRSLAMADTSSCASESTRSLSISRRSRGSSRHYWDLGGAGSESAVSVVAGGGLGGWGEV